MEFECGDAGMWREALSSYETGVGFLEGKKADSDIVKLDDFYRKQLPNLLHQRDPNPYISKSELYQLMRWKLTRGKWRPRLLDFISSLDETQVESASKRAFESLPDVTKAVTELTTLKGVGPATASAVLAAYAPHIAPFMSDEAMEAALGSSKDYSLKQYLIFVDKLQKKAKELSMGEDLFTPDDVERALWSAAVGAKLQDLPSVESLNPSSKRNTKRKRMP